LVIQQILSGRYNITYTAENQTQAYNLPFCLAESQRLKLKREGIRQDLRSVIVKLDKLQKDIKSCKEDAAKLESDDLLYKVL